MFIKNIGTKPIQFTLEDEVVKLASGEKKTYPDTYFLKLKPIAKAFKDALVLELEDSEVVEEVIQQYLIENPPTFESFEATPSRLVYIDRTRTDEYDALGTFEKPFKTIAAALQYAKDKGDGASVPYSFIIATGTYNENITLHDLGLFSVTLVGLGRVAINPTSGAALLSFEDNSDLQDLVCINLEFGKAIEINGSNVANNFKTTEFRNCAFAGPNSVEVSQINNIAFQQCYSEVQFFLSNVNYCLVRGCNFNQNFSFDTNNLNPLPANGINNGGMVVIGSTIREIQLPKEGPQTSNISLTGSRVGVPSTNFTIPSNVNVLNYSSILRGNVINGGNLVLSNGNIEGNLTGTAANINGNKSALHLYVPSDVSAWSGSPTSVNEAINRLAAEVAILKGSAIS